MNMRKFFGFAALFAAGVALSSEVSASERFMNIGSQTSRPIGHVQFCKTYPEECSGRLSGHIAKLTQAGWDELIAVNRAVNEQIIPVTDQDLYRTPEVWTLPVDRGDCEDYALLKKRILIDRGWPESALLITVVRDTNGEGHAVLTVSTDLGDFILDNQIAPVLPWNETPYTYLKRQSHHHGRQWVSINDFRPGHNSLAMR